MGTVPADIVFVARFPSKCAVSFSRNCRILKIVLGGNATSYHDLEEEKKSNSFNKQNKNSESVARLWQISSPLFHDLRCKNKLDRNAVRSSL